MPQYFRCHHCKQSYAVNKRLKCNQHYCSSPTCQQARKNQWEREKNHQDERYHQKRQKTKSTWRKQKPAHAYQKAYRCEHPLYEQNNRKQQQMRRTQRSSAVHEAKPSVVKTDALTSVSIGKSGLYKIRIYKTGKGEKIVKTDTLLIELLTREGLQERVMTG
jgi:hypothetical protein